LAEQAQDKTEEPTPHKLQEARKKGQVVKSKEVTTAVLVIVAYKVFGAFADDIWYRIVNFGNDVFMQLEHVGKTMNLGSAVELTRYAINTLLLALLPVLLTVFLTTIIIEALQTQFVFSLESMKVDLNKLNPMNGLKRIFSVKGFVQILITLIKIILVAMIVWGVIKKNLPVIITAMTMTPWNIMLFVGSMVMQIATKVGIFYLAIAVIDYFYQKQEFHKSMMMTKQEVKEEYKRLEGDPTIKQAQRQKQREMSQKRQQGAVPGADVVVTNPIHLACAIRYNANIDKAPVLVAKGKRLIAQEIKDIAEEHYIPIVENEVLARKIFDSAEAGDQIPPELYRAVAEILAFVYKLGRNKENNKARRVVNWGL
jgi:flagellar biosynthetic protein FlhB